MNDPLFGDYKATMFYCGDDPPPSRPSTSSIDDLAFDPVDAGPLTSARYLEPLAMLYIHLAVQARVGLELRVQDAEAVSRRRTHWPLAASPI